MDEGNEYSFENDCYFNISHQYANWKTNEWGNAPICIPEAVDVFDKAFIKTVDPLASDYGHMYIKKKEHLLKGQQAEKVVHKAIQISPIGGILIQNFDMGELWKKVSSKPSIFPEKILKELKQLASKESLQIDSLLFHGELGIVIMECKASKTFKNMHKVTKEQAIKAEQRLLELFYILTGELCCINISTVLCFPNADKCNIDFDEQFHILDQENLSNQSSFEHFWQRKIHINRSKKVANFFENNAYCRFVAMVYGFRSSKIISSACNAMEIHRMVFTQQSTRHINNSLTFFNDAVQTNAVTQPDAATTIFLNSEQLAAYEAAQSGGNHIIFGPPGSGKTLLIMMLVKEASESNRAGNVFVFLPNIQLACVFEKFLLANNSAQKRKIVINPSESEIKMAANIESSDDIFADEDLKGRWIPKRNSGAAAVIAITIGRFYDPAAALNAKKQLQEKFEKDGYHVSGLTTVMRNTKSIFEYNKRFLMTDERIIIGHNIQGRAVQDLKTDSLSSACQIIVEKIEQLLIDSPFGSAKLLRLKDIAIIVAHEPVASQLNEIKLFLKDRNIGNGSIVEQLSGLRENGNEGSCDDIVAVDSATNVPSLEWCVVFLIDASNCPASKLLATPIVSCTRAVSSLVTISTIECDTTRVGGCQSFRKSLLAGFNSTSQVSSLQCVYDQRRDRLLFELCKPNEARIKKWVVSCLLGFIIVLLSGASILIPAFRKYFDEYEALRGFLTVMWVFSHNKLSPQSSIRNVTNTVVLVLMGSFAVKVVNVIINGGIFGILKAPVLLIALLSAGNLSSSDGIVLGANSGEFHRDGQETSHISTLLQIHLIILLFLHGIGVGFVETAAASIEVFLMYSANAESEFTKLTKRIELDVPNWCLTH